MLENKKVHHKFLIIGAGPVGVYAAIRFGLYNQQVVIVDSRNEIGGQCTALYKEKPLYDIPGIEQINGGDFIKQLVSQFNKYNHILKLSTTVTNVTRDVSGLFSVEFNNSDMITVENIIIASGGGFYSPISLGIEINDNISKHVYYSVENSELFKNKDLAILGGGDSAIDWCLSLSKIAKSISLIHRGKCFRGAASNANLLNNIGNVNVYLNSALTNIVDNATNCKLSIKQFEENKEIDVDEILVFYGLTMKNSLSSFDIIPNSKNGKVIVNPTTEESSVHNMFAIGDISTYEYKKPNLTTGFGQAVQLVEYMSKVYF